MIPATLLAVVLPLLALVAEASNAHAVRQAHNKRVSAVTSAHGPRALKNQNNPVKRCRVKVKPNANNANPKPPKPTESHGGGGGGGGGGGSVGHASGVIHLNYGPCGNTRASTTITKTDGPNGAQDWLNCGIEGAGWNPPPASPQDIVYMSLADALKKPNSIFRACTPYLSIFRAAAAKYNLPDVLLASISMQESSCVASTTGGNGEQGLMQITVDKCHQAPNGNCKDPHYNIFTGAAYLRTTLNQVDNNIFLAMGMYNGWFRGLTVKKATAAKGKGHCFQQNNLDYIHQVFNGFCQGIDGSVLGRWKNLDSCKS